VVLQEAKGIDVVAEVRAAHDPGAGEQACRPAEHLHVRVHPLRDAFLDISGPEVEVGTDGQGVVGTYALPGQPGHAERQEEDEPRDEDRRRPSYP
jgi:hypothetical protein